MTKNILLLMLVGAMGMTSAEAQWRPGPGRGPDDRGPGRGPGRGPDDRGPGRGPDDRGPGRRAPRERELVAYINQSIRGHGTIDLNYELRLDRFRGRGIQVEEVILVASSREGRWRRGPPAEASLRSGSQQPRRKAGRH